MGVSSMGVSSMGIGGSSMGFGGNPMGVSSMSFSGQSQGGGLWQGGSHPSSGHPSPVGSTMRNTFHSGGEPSPGRSPAFSSGDRGSNVHEGSNYATGHNFHLGGARHTDPSLTRSHPAGALEVPRHLQGQRRPMGGFSVTGFNPAHGPALPQMRPQQRPFGLAASASANSLFVGSNASPGLSPMGGSAMSMDATWPAASVRSSSGSPPPPRRRLVESTSAPRLGEELPPLAGSSASKSPSRLGAGMSGTAGSMRGQRQPSAQDLAPSWRPPRTKHVDDILSRSNNTADAGIAGWALSAKKLEFEGT